MKQTYRKSMLGRFFAFGLVAALCLGAVDFTVFNADAKGGSSRSSSSSRSSGFGSSRSSSSSSRSASKPSSSSRSSGFGSKKSAAPVKKALPPKPLSKADQALKAKAQKNGTSFKSKSAAQDAFKTKNATKYTSKYTSKPTTRPEHIPSTTKGPNGNTYNVTYNQANGGYGYMNSLGAFVAYDMMSDAIMMNSMMRSQGYYVTPPVQYAYSQPVHTTSGAGILFIVLIAGGLLVFALVIFRS